jgi:hypothetical protein
VEEGEQVQSAGYNKRKQNRRVADLLVNVSDLRLQQVRVARFFEAEAAVPPEARHVLEDVPQQQQHDQLDGVDVVDELEAEARFQLVGYEGSQAHHAQEAQVRVQDFVFAVDQQSGHAGLGALLGQGEVEDVLLKVILYKG